MKGAVIYMHGWLNLSFFLVLALYLMLQVFLCLLSINLMKRFSVSEVNRNVDLYCPQDKVQKGNEFSPKNNFIQLDWVIQ